MRKTVRLSWTSLWLFSTCFAWLTSLSLAADLPPTDAPIEQVIDQFVNARLMTEKITPAPQADDHNLLRRLSLDLAGRIPTTAEAQAFAASTSPTKRVELVDRLLASPDFPLHQRNELDQLLLAHKPNDGEFRKYLLWATQQNRPWDAMFRDMLVGIETDENQKGALTFVKSRARELDDLTNDTASLFFGVNVSCAKCHDHPLATDWKQDHFYGMTAFFSRTYLTKKNLLAEKQVGEVKFSTKKDGQKQAAFLFLTGATISEPTVERTKEQLKEFDEVVKKQTQDDNASPPEKPGFSPREKLVEVALRAEDNRFFARNCVNRIWAQFFSRGIVDPVDQMHSANAPSHPELLDWLTRDLVAHGYDMKRLIRGIVLSQTYSRSSEWTAGELPSAALYAVAKVKPLTPRQYALSLFIAAINPTQWLAADQPDKWTQRREQLENEANGWANMFEVPGEGFQVAVDEALLFTNNKRIEDEFLRDSGDRLVGYLKTLSDDSAMIDAAFWSVNSRSPRDDERAALKEYLQKHAADRVVALRQIVWALLASPELRVSY
ncbi:MAG: DUF1549 and DUF1553 domain-containing protein [Planctomycetia bacterium]|nr:DUF1549 and DUF1553 domain-containing protein [Planctomycetia bacterium]